MKKLFIIMLCTCSYNVFAQVDTSKMSFKLDLLKAPASPASNLLGFATSDIDKPTDVSDFMVSLQSATGGFTALPTNYAIDIAPFLLFAKESSDTKKRETSNKNIIKQSLVLSFAYKNPDSSETILNQNNSYGGFGFKVSLLRGRYNSQTTRGFNKINYVKMKVIQDNALNALATQQNLMNNDPELKEMVAKRDKFAVDNKTSLTDNKDDDEVDKTFKKIEEEINEKYKELGAQMADDKYEKELKEVASTFQVERYGLSLDVAGGISGEFLNKRFDSSRVHNAGLWFNLGYTGKTGVSFIGLGRYLYNPDQIVPKGSVVETSNTSNYDLGGRLIYSKPQSKFSGSLEYISRWSSADAVKRTWRFVFNADYALWENQKLTFSFGRNFDGTITKDGNLVAALSFLTGFGNKRK